MDNILRYIDSILQILGAIAAGAITAWRCFNSMRRKVKSEIKLELAQELGQLATKKELRELQNSMATKADLEGIKNGITRVEEQSAERHDRTESKIDRLYNFLLTGRAEGP